MYNACIVLFCDNMVPLVGDKWGETLSLHTSDWSFRKTEPPVVCNLILFCIRVQMFLSSPH